MRYHAHGRQPKRNATARGAFTFRQLVRAMVWPLSIPLRCKKRQSTGRARLDKAGRARQPPHAGFTLHQVAAAMLMALRSDSPRRAEHRGERVRVAAGALVLFQGGSPEYGKRAGVPE